MWIGICLSNYGDVFQSTFRRRRVYVSFPNETVKLEKSFNSPSSFALPHWTPEGQSPWPGSVYLVQGFCDMLRVDNSDTFLAFDDIPQMIVDIPLLDPQIEGQNVEVEDLSAQSVERV